MSTTIFKLKVTEQKVRQIDSEELIAYCYLIPHMDFSHRDYCKQLSINIKDEPNIRKIPHSRFLELLKENYEKKETLFDPLIKENEKLFAQLKQNYTSGQVTYLTPPHILIWNNILASLNMKGFELYPVAELAIDVVQVEGGIVGFPNHRGLGICSSIYRRFLIRILMEIQQDGSQPENQTIENWFTNNNGDLYPDDHKINFGNCELENAEEGIIWGIKEHERFIIELANDTFWKEHKKTWWAKNLKDRLLVWLGDDDYPLRIARYNVIIHPAWFKEMDKIVKEDKIYDSTAY